MDHNVVLKLYKSKYIFFEQSKSSIFTLISQHNVKLKHKPSCIVNFHPKLFSKYPP